MNDGGKAQMLRAELVAEEYFATARVQRIAKLPTSTFRLLCF